MYLFSSWAPQISHSCTKKEALVFLLNECRYLKPGKKLPRFFIQLKIHLAKVQKTHTLLRLWTTACTAAPPKEEVKSSPCWSTMVTTDSKSSARRLVGPLSLPECSDIRYNVVDMVSLVRELRSSASKTRWTQPKWYSPSMFSALHVRSPCLKCAVTSCKQRRGKTVNIKNTNKEKVLRRTLRSWRHTVVSPSSDKHSFGNSFANLKTWSLETIFA